MVAHLCREIALAAACRPPCGPSSKRAGMQPSSRGAPCTLRLSHPSAHSAGESDKHRNLASVLPHPSQPGISTSSILSSPPNVSLSSTPRLMTRDVWIDETSSCLKEGTKEARATWAMDGGSLSASSEGSAASESDGSCARKVGWSAVSGPTQVAATLDHQSGSKRGTGRTRLVLDSHSREGAQRARLP